MTGPIKNATSLADALKLQYYEEPDALKAGFGHELTRDDWYAICNIVEVYGAMLFTSPLVCFNSAHPMLQELKSEEPLLVGDFLESALFLLEPGRTAFSDGDV